ncbi:MAG: clostripain-related cysteine peptidase [Anaerolineae bacterium]
MKPNKTYAVSNTLFLFLCLFLAACDSFPSFSSNDPDEQNPAELPTIASQAATLTPVVIPTDTPVPTPIPPTPTIDPSLPDWTVLIYMAADNSLDEAAIFNLNQMEAAELSDNVQVVVQLDRAAGKLWSDTRRYRIIPDDDPTNFSSEPLEVIGELNMGDPSVLADFIAWGLTAYPAKRTALIMWDHGVGWSGIADDDTDSDQLTLDELERGLAAGLVNQPHPQKDKFQFDMIGFDACLMGQLDVYQALVPYAEAAAASEELTPAAGWPYTAWLNELSRNSAGGGQTAARLATETFIDYYTNEAPSDFVTMAAVDLQQVGAVADSLNNLTTLLSEDINLAASLIAPARAGTEIYAKAYGLDAEQYGAIDLHHFSTILGDQSPDPDVAALAQAVARAVDLAVITSDSGRGLANAAGISLYFPSNSSFVNKSYANESALLGWEKFLNDYHNATVETYAPPEITIFQETINENTAEVPFTSENRPLWLGFQVSGLGISGVNLLVGQTEIGADEVERLKLLEFDPLIPEPTRLVDGSLLYDWKDGLHEDFYIWHSRVTWLQDDFGNGQFVILWPSTKDGSGSQRTVRGVLLSAASGEESEASLVFDTTTRQSIQAWAFTPEGTPYEISAQPGDVFTPYNWYLAADGSELERELGQRMSLNGAAQLAYEWRPVPNGVYQVGFEAENSAGEKNRALIQAEVVQTGLPSRTFLDPYTGFQFDYPADWYRPTWSGELLFTTDQTGDTAFQVTIFDQTQGITAEQVQAQAIATFGSVNLLYQDRLEIAGNPAVSTAYGYTDQNGLEHTGLFYTFVSGENGYLIDVDGLRENETATIDIASQIAQSWRFRPIGSGLFPGRWPRVDLDRISVPNPEDFDQRESGGWQRFQAGFDSRIFMALRTDAEVDRSVDESLGFWAKLAADGVNGYSETPSFRLAVRDRIWARRDFSYVGSSGQEVWGFIMVSESAESNEQIIAWAEAPAANYNQVEQNVFAIMLTEIERR